MRKINIPRVSDLDRATEARLPSDHHYSHTLVYMNVTQNYPGIWKNYWLEKRPFNWQLHAPVGTTKNYQIEKRQLYCGA